MYILIATFSIFSQAYKEGKKERPPFSQDPEPVIEKPEIPEDLLCNICKDLLTDAVMIPCCGNSFCDECKSSIIIDNNSAIIIDNNSAIIIDIDINYRQLTRIFLHLSM